MIPYNKSMTYQQLMEKILQFRKERDWEQFHTPKDLAISISLEASELLEVFQWSGKDLHRSEKHREIAEELADIMIYCLYLAHDLGMDPLEIMEAKIQKNEEKYPADKVRGSSKKYTEYDPESGS